MESPPTPSSERKKLLRSCNACRISKTRCLPDGDNEDLCQRCQRLGKQCVFAEARGRAKGVKRFPHSKLADVEKRINDIYSMLQSDGSAQSESSLVVVPDDLSSPSSSALHSGTPSSKAIKSPSVTASIESLIHSSNGAVKSPADSDIIQRGIISYEDAQDLLHIFIRDYANASFIWPMGDTSLASMRRDHPVTLLAVFMVTAYGRDQLRETIQREFREVVARKTIVDGKKDLDLLRGIMLHVLWYSTYPDIRMGFMYTYDHLAITICVDLEIGSMSPSQPVTLEKLEQCRLFLVTYLASSGTSMSLRKPPPLFCTEAVKANRQYLMKANPGPADQFIIRAIDLQRIKEEVMTVFLYDNPRAKTLNIDTVEMTINAYARELEATQAAEAIPDEFFQTLLELSVRHAWICLYEVALHLRNGSNGTSPEIDSGAAISLATRRSNLLIRCVEVVKTWSDLTANLPTRVLEQETIIHKCQLASVAVLMLKLSFNTQGGTPQNPRPLYKAVNMLYYMNIMANPCKDHNPANCDGNCAARDPLFHFRSKVRRLKYWFERLEAFGGSGGSESLKNMSTLNLEEIEKQEERMFQMDWSMIDFENMDLSTIM